jgi:hypothetical protein
MSAGKGDKARPVDGEKYRSNYDRIFNKKQEVEKTKKRQKRKFDTPTKSGN